MQKKHAHPFICVANSIKLQLINQLIHKRDMFTADQPKIAVNESKCWLPV